MRRPYAPQRNDIGNSRVGQRAGMSLESRGRARPLAGVDDPTKHVLVSFAGVFKQRGQRVPKLLCLRLGEAEAEVVQLATVGSVIDFHGVILPPVRG